MKSPYNQVNKIVVDKNYNLRYICDIYQFTTPEVGEVLPTGYTSRPSMFNTKEPGLNSRGELLPRYGRKVYEASLLRDLDGPMIDLLISREVFLLDTLKKAYDISLNSDPKKPKPGDYMYLSHGDIAIIETIDKVETSGDVSEVTVKKLVNKNRIPFNKTVLDNIYYSYYFSVSQSTIGQASIKVKQALNLLQASIEKNRDVGLNPVSMC